MKEHPVLFNDAAVRAIRDRTKTQTRRPVVPQPIEGLVGCERYSPTLINRHGEEYPGEEVFGCYDDESGWTSPFGGPGTHLWVRECWGITANETREPFELYEILTGTYDLLRRDVALAYHYRATDTCPGMYWRPSIHMPRRASRITLLVADVRVERLQDISIEDVLSEGIEKDTTDSQYWRENTGSRFTEMWNYIYAAWGYGWTENPWVWVATFEVISGGAK
jgi:hypothetical protein